MTANELHALTQTVETAVLPQCAEFRRRSADAAPPTNATGTPESDKVTELRKALSEQSSQQEGDATTSLPPAFAFLGQFIDHDITLRRALSDAQAAVVDLSDAPGFALPDRAAVTAALRGNFAGQMDLDSLYGPCRPSGNAAADKLFGLMRWPGDRAKMRLEWVSEAARNFHGNLPHDGAADLLRLGGLMASGAFTRSDFDALPVGMRGAMSRSDGSPDLKAAVIGDPRNDADPRVAQLHVAFLRFHNRMVDAWPQERRVGDADMVFAWAREQVTLHYQWLVINVFLPATCDPEALEQVMASGAAIYDDFLSPWARRAADIYPMPLEFSVAAFRLGHSIVRGIYDRNPADGRGSASRDSHASLADLLACTGRAPGPMLVLPDLPSDRVIGWQHADMPLAGLADRTLRGVEGRARTPGAQACIAALNAVYGFAITPLSAADLTEGETGAALKAAGHVEQTPLWYYIRKEAEVCHRGTRLGPLGTHLVAGTIAGLIINDADSVWHRHDPGEERWHPVDGARVSDELVDSLPALLRAALLLER